MPYVFFMYFISFITKGMNYYQNYSYIIRFYQAIEISTYFNELFLNIFEKKTKIVENIQRIFAESLEKKLFLSPEFGTPKNLHLCIGR